MKKIKKGGREYLELPGDLLGKKLTIVRLDEGLYVVGTEDKVRRLVTRQVSYLMNRRQRVGGRRVIKKAEQSSRDDGYWIFDSEAEAARFSHTHAFEFQSGQIRGIRGFDGKFYAMRSWLYGKYLPRVLELLKSAPMSVRELATKLGVNEGLVRVVLELAREEGLVIERSGGVYEYAG